MLVVSQQSVRYSACSRRVQVSSFRQPLSAVTVGRGLTWSLSGASISLHGDWRIRYRIIFPISDHGSFDASVSGASISVSVTLGASAAGEPTIRTTGCTCHIDRVRIRLHGGASWLYNLFMGAVERLLRDNLQWKLCQAAQDAINTDAARELATLPVKVPLGPDKRWLLDYRLVSAPAFASGYLESFHKGEFFNAGDSTEAPFQPSRLPSPATADRMLTFWASSYVLNTAGYVLQKRGVLRHDLTKKDLPERSRDRLKTTCSLWDGCIGALVPPVGRKYPNASVEIEMFSSASPAAVISPQNVTGNFAGVAVFRARLADGSLAHLFTMNITAKITVILRLDGTVLKANVTSIENALAVTDSSVGPISTMLLGRAFNVAKNTFIIPNLNEVGQKGFPLPTIKHVRFTNAGLLLENDCVRVFTDVTYSSSTLYFQP